ncbi:MAG TPA: hypothetical protein VEV44_05600 [Pseudoneobacillus sp.]|nr:hypothetical protein [Pseudoneobacillus sp.]
MFKVRIRFLLIIILLIAVYVVFVQSKTVSYQGEDYDWKVKYSAKIVGLDTSYRLRIKYKGKRTISDVEFNIHPYYAMGIPSLNDDGSYVWECKGECRYIGNHEELLSFISWKEGKYKEEQMRFILLKKFH